MKNLYKYLGNGVTEAFIKLDKDMDNTKEMRCVKSYAFYFNVTANTEIIYGCNMKGEGFKLLHVVLDKPIERKSSWLKHIEENMPEPDVEEKEENE